MDDNQDTMKYSMDKMKADQAREILKEVYNDLKEKGYNPVNQIVGYLLSGDPTYITSYKNARGLIKKLERDELVEELVKYYLQVKN